jgi:uncharacterized protein YbjT (DUF2867 family)
MPDRKVIAVIGATGAQGGGLVRAILADPSGGFAARAVTRNSNSEKARELAHLGAEVVQADAEDVDSLKRAFEGAYGVYCVTFFWEHFSPDREFAQASAMANAAHHAGVRHAIWSTLEDSRKFVPLTDSRMPTLMGRFKVPHFDAKAEADPVFTQLGLPTTFLLTSFYWENLIYFGMGPRKAEDGRLVFSLPMGECPLPSIAAEDIGRCAYGIFSRGRTWIGKTVGIAGEHLTGAAMAAALTRALGQEVHYVDIPPEIYRTLGFPGAEDLGNMFQFNRDFSAEFCRARDLQVARSLNPQLQTFDAWLARNKDRIPIS